MPNIVYTLIDLFYTVVELNIKGLAAAVCVALILALLWRTRASKTALLLLWVVVAFRLVCPWSPPSPLSLFNFYGVDEYVVSELDDLGEDSYSGAAGQDSFHGVYRQFEGSEDFDQAVKAGSRPITNEITGRQEVSYTKDAKGNIVPILSAKDVRGLILSSLWLLGMAGLLGYSVVSYLRLKRRLRFAVKDIPLPDIWYSDRISSPCVVGVFRPQIYLTFGMSGGETPYVLAHERQHIQNRDHLWKVLAWFILCIHWFNPLLWIFYRIFLKMVEDACDQRVLRQLGEDRKADYSQALLTLSAGRQFRPGPSPIAFDEGNTKKRVKTILKYKKPLVWVTVIAVAAAAVVGVCLFTDPAGTEATPVIDAEPSATTPSEDTPTATISPDEAVSSEELPDTTTSDWEDLVLTWYIPLGADDPMEYGFPLTFLFTKEYFSASCAGGTPYAYNNGTLLSGHPIEKANGSTLYWWPYEEGSDQPVEHGNITAAVYYQGERRLACSLLLNLVDVTETELVYSVRATLHDSIGYLYLENPDNFGGEIRTDDPETAFTAPLATFSADLTHDGVEETILIHGDYPTGGTGYQGYYVLVHDKAGRGLWSGSAGISHAGQNGIYLYEEDGTHYLMEWCNYGQSGDGSIRYTVFSLTETGEQVVYLQNNFGMEFDVPLAVDLDAYFAIEEESIHLLSHSIVLVSSNGDTPNWEYYSTPDHILTPVLQDNYLMWWTPEELKAIQAKAQGTYTFRGEVVTVFEDKSAILVEDQSLWIDNGSPLYFLIPVDDPQQYACDMQVRVTANGPLYRRDLPDEGTQVTVEKLS